MSSWLEWFKGANFAIYACHFLASWSGRMWGFSMGVFLITIAPGSLELSAVYGLTMGASVLFFGTVVGDWVDRTPRLRAALISMILQNSFVIVCACVVLVLIIVLSEASEIDMSVRKVFYAFIIGLSVLSRLMKVGRVIVIERDWIVEIANSRKTPLTVMTSTFRRIDLLTKIFAPMISGQILSFAGVVVGCIFIAVWSVVSVCVEYFLIRRVYNIVDALREKKNQSIGLVSVNNEVTLQTNVGDLQNANEDLLESMNAEEKNSSDVRTVGPKANESLPKPWSPLRLFYSFIIIFKGFRTYISYDVKWAGFALASLYLTVLGFDGITVGYATTQGLSSSTLGILLGVGAVFGICATFTYPFIVKRLGLARTGVLALGMQLSCLSLCVISVFLPGSPFDLSYNPTEADTTAVNCSQLLNTTAISATVSIVNTTASIANSTAAPIIGTTLLPNITSPCQSPVEDEAKSMISVYVMMAGIVTARFGLWTADLTIIQLFLERVLISERGVVNGFQSSLNQMMDFFKYAMVAAIPFSHQFGLLIFISFSFICLGWSLMSVYAWKSWKRSRRSQREPQKHVIYKPAVKHH